MIQRLACVAGALLLTALPLVAQGGGEAYTEALVAYKRGELDEARTLALAAKGQADDTDPRPLFLLGRIALAQGEAAEGLKLIEEGVKLAPNNPQGKLYLGQAYFAQRDYRAAEQSLTEYLTTIPGNKDARLLLLYCEVGRGNFPAAGNTLLKLDQFDDLHPGYYFGKAAIAEARAQRDLQSKETAKAERNAELAETNLQAAQTMYGNETYGRYVRNYYQLFPPKAKPGSGDMMKDLFPDAQPAAPATE